MGAELTRRSFALGALSAAVLPRGAFGAAAEPKLRFGVLTDTHVTRDPKSFDRVRKALAVFRRERCDLVAHVGDLADEHWPEAHRMWRSTVDAAFPPEARPKEAYVYAAHDLVNFVPGKSWRLTEEESLAAYDAFWRNAGIPHGMFHSFDLKGVPFIFVPQHKGEEGQLKARLMQAEKDHPGNGPIFVFSHVAPENTVFNSSDWGCWWKTPLFARHPRVISISGHTHGSLRNERNIWQGDFTAVDAGCLQEWGSALPGHQTKPKQGVEVLVTDVFDDRVVFRRIDVRDGEEVREPWVVPLPFDPKTAPYRLDRRKAAAKPVAFPSGARLEADRKSDADAVVLSFPAAAPADDVFCYRVEAFRRGTLLEWESEGREDVYGEFHLRPSERTGRLVCRFPKSALNLSRPTRFVVMPVDFFGQFGKPLEGRI